MHAIAINGSPRKNWNTAQLLQAALEGAAGAGATTELINLYDLDYKGCISCFGCKRNGATPCKCYYKDELSPVLEKVLSADVLLLGSPIYFGDVTGQMRSFMERLLFPAITYNEFGKRLYEGHLNVAYFFTMNVDEEYQDIYQEVFENNVNSLAMFGGRVEPYIATETMQFDDYSKYQAAALNGPHRVERHAIQWPKDLAAAFAIGQRLARPLD